MFSSEEILKEVTTKVRKRFEKVNSWVHGISHVERVVANGRKIVSLEGESLAKKAGLKPERLAFLVELSCWMHDLGRTVERRPTLWGDKFNHALQSAKVSQRLLKKYTEDSSITPKELELVLQAIGEHNQPKPEHPNNIITRVLMDADRGEGFGYRGMLGSLQYNKVINVRKPREFKDYKRVFLQIFPEVISDQEKREQATHWFTFLLQWYDGGQALSTKKIGAFGKGKVDPLYTTAARKIYKKRFLILKKYLEKLKNYKK